MNLRLASVTRKERHRLGLGYKRILDGSRASGSGDVLERAAFMRELSQLIQVVRELVSDRQIQLSKSPGARVNLHQIERLLKELWKLEEGLRLKPPE